MNTKKLALLLFSITVVFTSCSNDDDVNEPQLPLGDFENGILISHEGNFGQGNASVSFVSNDFETVENNIFSSVNASPLGDTAQSIGFNGDFAYIVLNVSNTIEVVNRFTFESVATIDTGLINPRYITFANGKGYVSNWGDFTPPEDDYLAVINLTTNTVMDTISTSYLPEEIISNGNMIYVATGVFGLGDKVDVIDATTDELIETVTVGVSPNSLQLDSSNNLWVLSSENLIEINTGSNAIVQTFDLTNDFSFPSDLNFDNGNLYFYDSGSVFKMSETATSVTTSAEFSGVSFYDMRVNNGVLYGLDAADFASNGSLQVYDLSTNTETQSITLSIIPGEVYFN